jgi:soluble lytic murein transglycosylase-like protein
MRARGKTVVDAIAGRKVAGAAALAAALLLAVSTSAGAQVLEVHLDGSVVEYDGPTQYLSSGSQPIARLIKPGMRRLASRTAVAYRAAPTPSAATADAIHVAAQRHQVDERLVTAVAWRESGFNQGAISPKGAQGVMQLMPETARSLGVDASDAYSNIDGGADYLSRLMRRFNGDTVKALAAYNAGPAAVDRYGGVPPYAETIAYVNSILGHLGRTDDLDSGAGSAATTLKTRMGAF